MRDGLAKLTREDVNAAMKRTSPAKDLSFVIVTKDAKALADALVADDVSTVEVRGGEAHGAARRGPA